MQFAIVTLYSHEPVETMAEAVRKIFREINFELSTAVAIARHSTNRGVHYHILCGWDEGQKIQAAWNGKAWLSEAENLEKAILWMTQMIGEGDRREIT